MEATGTNGAEPAGDNDFHMVARRAAEIEEILDGQNLLLRFSANGETHELNSTEGILWALAGGRRSVKWITEKIQEIHPAPGGGARSEVNRALGRLVELGLISLSAPDIREYPVDTTGFSHLVSTRGGLYLINQHEYRQIAEGLFFGICSAPGAFLVYDFPHYASSLWQLAFRNAKKQPTYEGRILRFGRTQAGIEAPVTELNGVSNSCHYIARYGDALFSVDCEEQQISRYDRNGAVVRNELFPGTYHHINTMVFRDDMAYIVKSVHSFTDITSSVVILDHQWQSIAEVYPAVCRAHDLVFDPDSEPASPSFWCCDSNEGFLVHYPSGRRLRVRCSGEHGSVTRGLARSGDTFVVGSGFLVDVDLMDFNRHHGWVHWVDMSTGRKLAEIELPQTPCCIVPLDEPRVSV